MKYKLADYLDAIKTTQRLADYREKKERTHSQDISPFGEKVVDLYNDILSGKNDDLLAYLNSLDFDTIKVISAVAYLGRDCQEKKDIGADENLNQWMENEMDFCDSKDAEVLQIYGKSQLGTYIKRGLETLGVNY